MGKEEPWGFCHAPPRICVAIGKQLSAVFGFLFLFLTSFFSCLAAFFFLSVFPGFLFFEFSHEIPIVRSSAHFLILSIIFGAFKLWQQSFLTLLYLR